MISKKGLYIHIPFCVKKCDYCDFLSAPSTVLERKEYVECLKREILAYQIFDYKVDTVFLGGGTPSLLSESEIVELMEMLRKVFQISKDAEITIECNPETVERDKLAAIRAAGINRISFGLQSASDKELLALGRIHTYERFLLAYQAAEKAGFSNINVDLMSAVPGQTMESWEETLSKVIELEPAHISTYSLILEEGTVLYQKQKELDLPDEDTERQMYYRTKERLAEAGYQQYEISNFAKPGLESRHNLKYWSLEEYIGIGLGASSCLDRVRFHNPYSMEEYRKSCACLKELRREEEFLTRKREMEEFCFLGLRKIEGISAAEFLERFGESIDVVYGEVIKRFESWKLLMCEKDRVFLTDRGIDVSNQVFAGFLLD